MNEIGMTSKDIKERIKKEEKYLKVCKDKILEIKSDIKSTEMCIKWWNKQLNAVEKKEKKNGKH